MTRASLTHSSWVVGGDGVGRDVVVVSAKVLVAVRDKEDRGDNVVSEGDFSPDSELSIMKRLTTCPSPSNPR